MDDALETRADDPTDVEDWRPPPEPIPARIGRYVLLDRLGEGGMGVVYAAYDDKLDRKVAIKLLRARSEHGRLRLIREAQALARLSHPNVVQIYEIAETTQLGSEHAYLVMEFVDGETLKQWRSVRPRSRAEILEVFFAAGRGLAAAHDAGLVHRDFKPDNVMIRRDGRVLVMDFGLALADPTTSLPVSSREHSPEISTDHLTMAGAVMGTPAYMAPEQFLGVNTDARTDQFAFCVALWEALYDERPFDGADMLVLSIAVTGGDITAPVRDELPAWLRAILERGLAVNPDARWSSMAELLSALGRDPTVRKRRILGALATVACAAGLVGAWSQREQDATATVDLAVCDDEAAVIADDWNPRVRDDLRERFGASGLEFADSAWASTARWMDDYAEGWSDARRQLCVARMSDPLGVSDRVGADTCLDERRAAFVNLLAAWRELDAQTAARAPLAAAGLPLIATCDRDGLDALQPPAELETQVRELRARLVNAEAINRAGRSEASLAEAQAVHADATQLGWGPLVAESLSELGQLNADLGRPEIAAEQLHAAGLAAVASGHDRVALEAATNLCVVVGRSLARHAEARQWGELAVALIERLDLHDTVWEADVLSAIADVQSDVGEVDEALAAAIRALAIREATYGPEHPEVALSLDEIGSLLVMKGDLEQGLEHFERSLAIRSNALGPDHLEVAYSLNGIGGVEMHQLKPERALATFERSQRIVRTVLGPDHVELAPSYNNLGLIHWQLGDLDTAAAAFAEAQRIQEQVSGPNHPRVAAAIDNLGNVLVSQGNYDDAIVAHRRALAIRLELFGPDHADVASSRNNLATVLIELGRYDEAMAELDQAVAIWTPTLGVEHPNVAAAMTNIADLHVRLNHPERAEPAYTQALASFELALGPDTPYLAYPLVGLGRLWVEQGRLDEAEVALVRALNLREATPGPANELADVEFGLAKLARARRDDDEARRRGARARDGYREAGLGSADELAEVQQWLAGLDE